MPQIRYTTVACPRDLEHVSLEFNNWIKASLFIVEFLDFNLHCVGKAACEVLYCTVACTRDPQYLQPLQHLQHLHPELYKWVKASTTYKTSRLHLLALPWSELFSIQYKDEHARLVLVFFPNIKRFREYSTGR